MVKILRTKESVLEKKELEDYLAKFAADNIVKLNSDAATYPIPRLKDNCQYIFLTYTLLNEHAKIGIQIHPAGEWLLDNYYIIEKSVKTIEKDLSLKKYKKFPGLADSGFARIFSLANEIVSNTDGKIEPEDLQDYLIAYQTQKNLNMEEIWSIGTFLQICIVEKLRHICERIFISQMQKCKVENIINRTIEGKALKKIDEILRIDPSKDLRIEQEGKYQFIEYMSYRLKRYGKKAVPYLNTFEEQVNKMGMSISDVINREHFDIAIKRLSIKNSITSIKTISRMDILRIFNNVNVVEKILKQDPANVYEKMDYTTKAYYRAKIIEISKRTKISEIYVVKTALELCKSALGKEELKKAHVGYYLIDEGIKELLSVLTNKKIKMMSSDEKAKIYVFTIYLISILTTISTSIFVRYFAILLFIPIQNVVTRVVQYILSKCVKTRIIPKLNLKNEISSETPTMCALPVVLESPEDVKKMFEKMEVYYLANKSKNLFFTLLGDCTSGKTEIEEIDKKIIDEGIRDADKLNQKYGNIFFFTYRKREWSDAEQCYMGWERKRGMINQFNEFLETGKSKFKINTCKDLPKIKYVISLDSDTNLTLNSAFQLVGAMSHILNTPKVDKIKNQVISGHALIQPRIGLDIEDGRRTGFSRLFAGNGGTDFYTNAVSDCYQDNFDEGIFTGKGIYDLDTFYEVLRDSIPENTVLSHDLLEGCYLRAGLASDILLLDGYPSNYEAYKTRNKRWIRGDVQILPWIKSKLNFLSKYKILDNVVRTSGEIFLSIALLSGFIFKIPKLVWVSILIIATPTIIELLDLLFGDDTRFDHSKLFVPYSSKWKKSIYLFFVNLGNIIDSAVVSIESIAKACYRMKISHSFLLEWITAEEAEKSSSNKLIDYYDSMIIQTIVGFILTISGVNSNSAISMILGLMWIFAPLAMYVMSKKIRNKRKISDESKSYLLSVGKKTWLFFKENMVNYLPSDNYQEDRKEKAVKRTSSTNIGLEILSTIASYDMKFESEEDTLNLLDNIINTVQDLPKWNGHLYNWYDIETLKPIPPYDISSVDSGNFIGYLYTAKGFLKQLEKSDTVKIKELIIKIDSIIKETDFGKLYDEETGLFSIGFNTEENKLYDSYYDLLASEARQTSLIAIAKRDVPEKHWHNLSRTITKIKNHKGLVSWGGTAFEYLMPNINIPSYQSTLLDESCKLLVYSQIEYAKKLGTPWGMSEAAYNQKDLYGNYQYKTFGIPWLGLKRGLVDETVISPYSSMLALNISPVSAISNIKKMEKEGALGKYGFYDSIDYVPKKAVVKTYMAHHQGMIMTAIDDYLNEDIFQTRFFNNPEIMGIKILLEENMPENVIITKEKQDKAKKIKYKNYDDNIERNNGINLISNRDYINLAKENGEQFSRLDDITIYQKLNIYIKDIQSKKIWDLKNTKHTVSYNPYSSKYVIEDGNLKATISTCISPDCQVEIKEIKLKNKGITDLNLEITSYVEPILSNIDQYNAHPSFDKMFLKYKLDEGKIILTRKARIQNERLVCLSTSLFPNNNIDFEIDKEKIMSRGNSQIPDAIALSLPFSNLIQDVVNPIIAMRKVIMIPPDETQKIYVLISANYNEGISKANLDEYMNQENLSRVFELVKAQTEAENRYMEVTGKQIANYQQLLEMVCSSTANNNSFSQKVKFDADLSDKRLWKYGISGNFPIISVFIKEINDYYVLEEIFKAYEYFLNKHIKLDVVIVTDLEIYSLVLGSGMGKYLNKYTGIFILKNLKREERKLIEARSSVVIDADVGGSLEVRMQEINKKNANTQRYKKSYNLKNVFEKINENDYAINEKEYQIVENSCETKEEIIKRLDLVNFNGYGGFNKDLSEYWIIEDRSNRVPVAWSNILANESFGTVVTDGLGGYSWYQNSRTNRVTYFSNDAFMDDSSEMIELECGGRQWSLGINEKPDDNNYIINYGFGYAKYIHTSCNIKQELLVYVPEMGSCKISVLKLKNEAPETKKITIKYLLRLIMGENNNGYINEDYNENFNMILFRNNKNPWYCTYITSNEKINGNKEIEINLGAYEEKNIVLVLGCENTEMECVDTAARFTNNYSSEFEKVKKYWKDKVQKITVKTPMKEFDALQNGWLVYQTLVSRMIAKTGFYQSSGGYGFRDQLQDAMGMKYVDSEILKNQILLHANHQFCEGDVEHWWHEDSRLGVRTRFSDDLLWLPYAVIKYIEFAGDYSILNQTAGYVNGEPLAQNQVDKVQVYECIKSGSIFEHCIKAIEHSIKFGKNGLPLMGSGDWNDGMNKVGIEGIGESVWLGFFLYNILKDFIKIIKYQEGLNTGGAVSKEISVAMNDNNQNHEVRAENLADTKQNHEFDYEETIKKYESIAEKIKIALNSVAWDGRWYKRAFDDQGGEVGSINSEECKIDSIAQSWAIISGAGDNDKKYIALESAEKFLLDDKNNIVKLLTPPLDKINLGYISSYARGMRENGGQYTHAAIWLMIAEAMMQKEDKIFEIYNKINPIIHTKTEEDVKKYKVEPYVIEADIYGEGNLAGRGGWTWYTGSSSWLYDAQTEYILGIKINSGVMTIVPCVPKDWENFEVELKWQNSIYQIKYKRILNIVQNQNDILVDKKIRIKIDGKEVDNVKLQKTGKYKVEVIFS